MVHRNDLSLRQPQTTGVEEDRSFRSLSQECKTRRDDVPGNSGKHCCYVMALKGNQPWVQILWWSKTEVNVPSLDSPGKVDYSTLCLTQTQSLHTHYCPQSNTLLYLQSGLCVFFLYDKIPNSGAGGLGCLSVPNSLTEGQLHHSHVIHTSGEW